MDRLFSVRDIVIIFIIVMAITVPFLNKPYHIDDPFVLHIAGLVIEHPFDPFYGNFDWFGFEAPVWELTTNPPLVSYYLAPFAAISDFSEIVLHAAMGLFFLIMAFSSFYLCKRFCQHLWLPVLFIMLSPGIVISMNVMRDVPAAALGTLAVALFVAGTDKDDWKLLLLGGTVAGLAVLAKYSSIIFLPVLFLYPFLKGKFRHTVWVLPILVLLGAWCLHNYIMYGNVHITYLLLEREHQGGLPKAGKAIAAIVIVSSILFLLPALIWDRIVRFQWWSWVLMIIIGVLTWWGANAYKEWQSLQDYEYQFWAVTGAITLYLMLEEGIRRGLGFLKSYKDDNATDALFLFAWVCAPVLFSIIFVPFNAVRHILPGVAPMVILAFLSFERVYSGRSLKLNPAITHYILFVMLVLKTGLTYISNAADYEYANVYRDFALEVEDKWAGENHSVWYTGHWGWMFYAEEAGFRQLSRWGEFPTIGDIVIVPEIAAPDRVFRDFGNYQDYADKHARLLEERVFDEATIPMRIMNFRGASFYAVTISWGPNIPYRFFSDMFLEKFYVFYVNSPLTEEEIAIQQESKKEAGYE